MVIVDLDWTRFSVRRFESWKLRQAKEPVSFADLGAVNVAYEARETREGKATRRYRISGPSLEGTSGTLWADADRGHIVEFELPIPDEPGFVDGRLRLLGVVPIAREAWEAFKRSRLGE